MPTSKSKEKVWGVGNARTRHLYPKLDESDPDYLTSENRTYTIWCPKRLMDAVESIIKSTKPKYNNRSHFMTVAMTELARKERAELAELMEGKPQRNGR